MGFGFCVLGSRYLRLCHSCPCHQIVLPEPICEKLEPSFCFADCAIGAQWLRKSLADSRLMEGDREATDQELGMDRKGDALAMMERDVGIIEPMSGKECVSFKVMLVEDDQGFRRTLARLLTSRFPSIVIGEAGDGGEAMEKVEDFLPNLIFMDIYLPGQSGLELTRRIKTLYPNIHIVMLTSYDFPEYREVARASGAYRFLSKGSSTADEIQELVEGLCAKWTPPGVQSTWYRKEAGNEVSRS